MANISQIKLPNGDTHNFIDTASGYTKNTGTITSVKTTAGAHSVIDISSGAVNFNVPTKTSHLTNDSGFVTTDEKVKQSVTTTTSWRKVLLHYSTNEKGGAVSTATNQVYAAIGVEVNPSTGTLAVSSLNSSGLIGGGSLNITGPATFGDTVSIDDLNAGQLVVSGSASFANNVIADTFTGKATAVADAGNNKAITIQYSGSGLSSSSWIAAWNGYKIGAISTANITGIGTTHKFIVPRVAKTADTIPGKNLGLIEEFTGSDSYGLPSNNYYYILSAQGSDTSYSVQLALGETINAVYYRRYASGSWGSWASLINTNTTYSAGTGLSLSSTTFSVKTGYTTSGNNRAVQADSNGNLYVVQTDTTYSSKAAASGGTDVSLVTTGEKYTWNSKTSNTGTITSVKTTAGTHTTINTTSGAVSFNVPTTAAHVGIKFGYTTSGNNRAVLQDSSGNLYVTQKDDNTTALTSMTGTLGIDHGGTGKTNALAAITNLGGPYLLAQGTEITASSNLDTAYKAMGTYYSGDSTRSQTLAGTVPVTGSGFKMITAIGYRTATLRQFIGGANNDLLYRSSQNTGSTWTKWYKFALLPSGSDDKTFAAVGGSTTPVYVNSSGIVTACSHTIAKSVPADAKFSDTTYTAGTGLTLLSTTFNVKLGYATSGNNRAVLADDDGNLYVTQRYTSYSSMTDAEIEAGTGTTARVITPARLKTAVEMWSERDIIQAAGTGTTSLTAGTITQVPLTTTLISRNNYGCFTVASNRIAINKAGIYRITGSVYVTASTYIGVYIRMGTGTFANSTEIASSLLMGNGGAINVTKTIQISSTQYIYLGARSTGTAGTVANSNDATYLEIEYLGN